MQSTVLNKFDYGIISNPDAEDISDKAAASSLNIDGDNEDGKLKGIPGNTEHTLSGSTSYGNVHLGKFIENSGVYDLIYHDSSANKINRIADFYNSGTKSDLVTTNVSDNICIQINNKEAHIGTGSASTNTPLWCGRPGHQTFGGIGIRTFTGAGLNDCFLGGNYTGTDNTYIIKVDGTGGTDTFTWSDDNGSTWEATNVSMETNTDIALNNGLVVRFENKTGHTLNNQWAVSVFAKPTFISEQSYLTSLENNVAKGYVSNPFSTTAKIYFGPAIGYTGVNPGSYFTHNYLFRWKFSVVYDGYQESPLSYDHLDFIPSVSDYYELKIPIIFGEGPFGFSSALYSQRITAIKLYRADSSTGNEGDLGFYKLIGTIDVNNVIPIGVYFDGTPPSPSLWKQYPGNTTIGSDDLNGIYNYYTAGNWAQAKICLFYDNGGANVSYEEETGMPSTLTNIALNYSLSAKGNGFHFVAGGYHPDITNASNYIFRSKGLRFDQFDYVNDFLVMPRVIAAMEFYEGKLYIFDENNMYRINPEGLYIEDVITGVGARGQRSVLQTAYGLFFCNNNGAYRYAGGQIDPISERIKVSASGGIYWGTLENGVITDTIVKFDSLRNQVLFIGTRTDTTQKSTIWAYHVIKDRWDYLTVNDLVLDANSGAFTGKDGEIYLSNATNTYKLLRNATGLSWSWTSKEFNMEHPSQNKWLGKILADPTSGVTITYGVEGASPTTAYTHGNNLDLYKKSLQIKVAGTSNVELDSIEIIYRLLVGLR